jgi:hypothetical protein
VHSEGGSDLLYQSILDGSIVDTYWGKLNFSQRQHIVPKLLLKADYESGEINEIAKMAFISS